jgi:hypothetical protein
MQDQRSADGSPPPEPEDAAAVILDILLGQHPGLLHVDELVRMYARSSIEHDAAAVIVDDAVSELLSSGLVHRLQEFVFASRTAVRGQQLAA